MLTLEEYFVRSGGKEPIAMLKLCMTFVISDDRSLSAIPYPFLNDQKRSCSVKLDLKLKMEKTISQTPSIDDECLASLLTRNHKPMTRRKVIQRLTVCSYHLLGNTFCQDLSIDLSIRNNHLIFGTCCCCHH